MQGMTKRERQITDPVQIRHILDTAKVLHLGLAVDNGPYVVPMNYGYTEEEGKLVLYLHSALKGKKLEGPPPAASADGGAQPCSPWISGFGCKTVGEYISAALSHELVVIAYSSPRTLRQPLGSKSYTSHMLSP